MNLQEEREKSRRYELAKMFSQEIARESIVASAGDAELVNPGVVARLSVELADALIAALKEEK